MKISKELVKLVRTRGFEIEHNGTLTQLNTVLEACYPKDESTIFKVVKGERVVSKYKYFRQDVNKKHLWFGVDVTLHFPLKVTDFFIEEDYKSPLFDRFKENHENSEFKGVSIDCKTVQEIFGNELKSEELASSPISQRHQNIIRRKVRLESTGIVSVTVKEFHEEKEIVHILFEGCHEWGTGWLAIDENLYRKISTIAKALS